MLQNRHIRSIYTLSSPASRRDAIPATRIALCVGVPLLVMLLIGEPRLSIYTAFGTFPALYGRNQQLKVRLLHQGTSGILMVLAVAFGILLSWQGITGWQMVLATSLMAALCSHIAMQVNVRPGGPLFYIFASAGVASLPYAGHAGRNILLTAAAAAFSVLVGVLLGELLKEGRDAPPPPAQNFTHPQMLAQTLTNFLTTAVAGLMGNTLGISHAYWAMVAAAAVLAGPNTAARVERGLHRMVGTAGGVLVAAFFVSMSPDPWHVAVLVVACQFAGEMFVLRNYAIAVVFITPLALFMIHLAHPFTSYELLTDRMVETALGAVIGMMGAYVSPDPQHVGKDTVQIPVVRVARDWRRRR